MRSKLKYLFVLLKRTIQAYGEDKVPRLGAALAYYAVFSLAPLLLIATAVAGFVFGPEAARGEIVAQFDSLLGESGARLVETMIEQAYQPAQGILASVLGIGSLVLGATGVFNQLQGAMNVIWDTPEKETGGILNTIKDRLLSMTMVVATGFLLLTSLVVSAGVAALSRYLTAWIGPGAATFIGAASFIISLLITAVMFALMFKYLPDTEVEWEDVWVGGTITAVLFSVGKLLIGLYLGNASVGSTYGAAGSMAIVLLWVYYSAQIFFLGAEFTYVYANETGSRKVQAVRVPLSAHNHQVEVEGIDAPQGSPERDDVFEPKRETVGTTAGEGQPWLGWILGATIAVLLYLVRSRD